MAKMDNDYSAKKCEIQIFSTQTPGLMSSREGQVLTWYMANASMVIPSPQKQKFGGFLYPGILDTLKLLPSCQALSTPNSYGVIKSEICGVLKEVFGTSVQFHCCCSFLHRTVKISFWKLLNSLNYGAFWTSYGVQMESGHPLFWLTSHDPWELWLHQRLAVQKGSSSRAI